MVQEGGRREGSRFFFPFRATASASDGDPAAIRFDAREPRRPRLEPSTVQVYGPLSHPPPYPVRNPSVEMFAAKYCVMSKRKVKFYFLFNKKE